MALRKAAGVRSHADVDRSHADAELFSASTALHDSLPYPRRRAPETSPELQYHPKYAETRASDAHGGRDRQGAGRRTRVGPHPTAVTDRRPLPPPPPLHFAWQRDTRLSQVPPRFGGQNRQSAARPPLLRERRASDVNVTAPSLREAAASFAAAHSDYLANRRVGERESVAFPYATYPSTASPVELDGYSYSDDTADVARTTALPSRAEAGAAPPVVAAAALHPQWSAGPPMVSHMPPPPSSGVRFSEGSLSQPQGSQVSRTRVQFFNWDFP